MISVIWARRMSSVASKTNRKAIKIITTIKIITMMMTGLSSLKIQCGMHLALWLVKSKLFRIWWETWEPITFKVRFVRDLPTNSKPSCRAPSTSATSSGEGPCNKCTKCCYKPIFEILSFQHRTMLRNTHFIEYKSHWSSTTLTSTQELAMPASEHSTDVERVCKSKIWIEVTRMSSNAIVWHSVFWREEWNSVLIV